MAVSGANEPVEGRTVVPEPINPATVAWTPALAWVHVLADGVTAIAYLGMGIALLVFARRRRDVPFGVLYGLFALLLLAAAAVHASQALSAGWSAPLLVGIMKLVAAVVAVTTFWFLLTNLPLALAQKGPQAFEAELERRRRFEEELKQLNQSLEQRVEERTKNAEEASRAKSEFLANMSHEVRTPITAILGYTDMLADERLHSIERDQAIEGIQRNGAHLLRLINDILDLSKIEAGKMELELQHYDPAALILETLSTLTVAAADAGARIERRVVGPIPKAIPTDPTRLRQILMNLVNNALKHSGARSIRVELSLHDEGDPETVGLAFAVIDDGRGIPPEQIPRLFEPFEQGDNSLTRRAGGSGLGLTICRRVAEALGGSITVASEMGRGSNFTLRIPIPRPTTNELIEPEDVPGEEPQTRASERPARGHRGRILVIDDGKDNQRILRYYLDSAGFQVEVADNGKVGIERALAETFDLVLMDMQMPVLDGHEATARLRELGFLRPIIGLTAHAMRGDREKVLRSGCDDYLAKPVTAAELVAAIVHHLPGSDRDVHPEPCLTADRVRQAEFDALARAYRQRLGELALELTETWRRGDRQGLERIAHDLKGTAGMYALDAVTETADLVVAAIREGQGKALIDELVEELSAAMNQAGAGAGAASRQAGTAGAAGAGDVSATPANS